MNVKEIISKNKFDLPNTTTSDTNKIIKSLNVNKAKRPGGILAKFVKMSTNAIDFYFANTTTNEYSQNMW